MAGDAQSPISKKSRRGSKLLALVLVTAIAAAVTAVIWQPLADQPENARPAKSKDPPGTFRPTQLQWRGLKLAPVAMMAFRPGPRNGRRRGASDRRRLRYSPRSTAR